MLESHLTALLPEDVAERCSGNTFVAVTRVAPRFQPELVCQFKDRWGLGCAAAGVARTGGWRARFVPGVASWGCSPWLQLTGHRSSCRRRCRAPTASARARRHDLIASLLTSCHIPLYFNGNLFTGYRCAPLHTHTPATLHRQRPPHIRPATPPAAALTGPPPATPAAPAHLQGQPVL